MYVPRSVLVALVALGVVASVAAVLPAAAQQETVTLTVGVETQSGTPVGGAELDASWDGGSGTATTASNGKAFLDVPSGANVTIEVTHPDYVRNRPLTVRDATEREVTIDVHPAGSLRVDVRDAGGAVADARVIVRKHGAIVAVGRSNETGAFRTGDIEQGPYTVGVVKSGYFRNVTETTVDGETRLGVSIRQGSIRLGVRVVDPHFSPPRPVGNATVRIADVGEFRTLDAGTQTVDVPVNTDLTITVTKAAYAANETTVSVGEEAIEVTRSISRTPLVNLTAVNERVVVGERVVVRAVDEYGDPIEGAQVSLDGETAALTGADGRAAVRLETAGNHTLEASANGRIAEPVTVVAVRPGSGTATATAVRTDTPSPTPTPTPEPTTSATIPGFTLGATLAALVAAALVTLGRRGRRDD